MAFVERFRRACPVLLYKYALRLNMSAFILLRECFCRYVSRKDHPCFEPLSAKDLSIGALGKFCLGVFYLDEDKCVREKVLVRLYQGRFPKECNMPERVKSNR